jgi:four helix bundle protein
MANSSYKDLIVWQKSMDLTTEVYKLVKLLPREELYGLSDQMRRAAVSIPSNIAEGQDRRSGKDFKSFLSIARGSKAELETQIEVCVRVGYLKEAEVEKALSLLAEIGRMTTALINNLKE